MKSILKSPTSQLPLLLAPTNLHRLPTPPATITQKKTPPTLSLNKLLRTTRDLPSSLFFCIIHLTTLFSFFPFFLSQIKEQYRSIFNSFISTTYIQRTTLGRQLKTNLLFVAVLVHLVWKVFPSVQFFSLDQFQQRLYLVDRNDISSHRIQNHIYQHPNCGPRCSSEANQQPCDSIHCLLGYQSIESGYFEDVTLRVVTDVKCLIVACHRNGNWIMSWRQSDWWEFFLVFHIHSDNARASNIFRSFKLASKKWALKNGPTKNIFVQTWNIKNSKIIQTTTSFVLKLNPIPQKLFFQK